MGGTVRKTGGVWEVGGGGEKGKHGYGDQAKQAAIAATPPERRRRRHRPAPPHPTADSVTTTIAPLVPPCWRPPPRPPLPKRWHGPPFLPLPPPSRPAFSHRHQQQTAPLTPTPQLSPLPRPSLLAAGAVAKIPSINNAARARWEIVPSGACRNPLQARWAATGPRRRSAMWCTSLRTPHATTTPRPHVAGICSASELDPPPALHSRFVWWCPGRGHRRPPFNRGRGGAAGVGGKVGRRGGGAVFCPSRRRRLCVGRGGRAGGGPAPAGGGHRRPPRRGAAGAAPPPPPLRWPPRQLLAALPPVGGSCAVGAGRGCRLPSRPGGDAVRRLRQHRHP